MQSIDQTKHTCNICENILSNTRSNIECPFQICKKSCCKHCFVTFIRNSNGTPTCMWCKQDLSTDFISRVVGSTIAKEVHLIRAKNVIETYEAELPYLQERVASLLKAREYKSNAQKLISEYRKFYEQIVIAHSATIKVKFMKYGKNGGRDLSQNDTPILYESKLPSPPIKKVAIERIINWVDHERCCLCDLKQTPSYCDTCNVRMCIRCTAYRGRINNDTETCLSCHTPFSEEVKARVASRKLSSKRYNFRPTSEILHSIHSKIENTKLCVEMISKFMIDNPRQTIVADVSRKQFIKKCPVSDCRGFLSSAWKCGLCHDFFCSKCHRPKTDTHQCDADDVASVEYLRNETKPCPKCHMPISKIDGCNQVWSPCCKIAFCWETGKIETGHIHSPEYFAYLRRIGRDVPRLVNVNVNAEVECNNNWYGRGYRSFTELFDEYEHGEYPRENAENTERDEALLDIFKRDCYNIERKYNQAPPGIDNDKHGILFLIGSITKQKWIRRVLTSSRKRAFSET